MPGLNHINADTDSLKRFATKLRKTKPEVYKALQVTVREAGTLVRDQARANASEFSKSIPPKIRLRASGNTATVSASGLLPVGFETGKTPARNRWRHPFMGVKDHWYGAAPPMGTGKDATQGPRPWLKPAAEAKGEEAKKRIVEGIERAIDDVLGGNA